VQKKRRIPFFKSPLNKHRGVYLDLSSADFGLILLNLGGVVGGGVRGEVSVLLLLSVLDVLGLLDESLLDGETSEVLTSSQIGLAESGVGSSDDGGLSVDGGSTVRGGQEGLLGSSKVLLVLVVVGALDGLLGLALVAVEGLLAVSPGDQTLIVSGAADDGLSNGHEGGGHGSTVSGEDGGAGNDGSLAVSGVGLRGSLDEGGSLLSESLLGESVETSESGVDGLTSESRDRVGLNITDLRALVLRSSIAGDLLLLSNRGEGGGVSERRVGVEAGGLSVESH